MNPEHPELFRSLAKHFSQLCSVPVSLVDASDRDIVFTEDRGGPFFCENCPNHCRLLSTMLYGCNEARRWRGRYTYYCPIGLVFSAVSIPESDRAVVAGPLIMGEPQDTLQDLPEGIDRDAVKCLTVCSSSQLRHMASVLEMAVCGIRYRPDIADDRNVVKEPEPEENARLHNSFPYMREQQEELRRAVKEQNKPLAREVLNQLLRYVYSPHPDQVALIRSRAVQLVWMLTGIEPAGEGERQENQLYRQVYIPALKNAATLEDVDITLAEMLHLYVDYSFDFSEIRHSDTIYRVMEYIKSNFSRKVTLEDISSYVHLSPSHLSGLFRKETGQTISAYLSFVRIEKSKHLLSTTDTPIAQIGALCGFEDQSYFTRVFRQQTGLSPKKYRQSESE